jgi:hypothetical protein
MHPPTGFCTRAYKLYVDLPSASLSENGGTICLRGKLSGHHRADEYSLILS